MAGTWTLDHHGAVALATFRRPPRNLMSMAAMSELEALVEGVATDPAVSVLVLTGGLAGFFVAHADTEDLARLGRGEPIEGDPGAWGRTLARLESMDAPVVAAINGQAWGGGCELAQACTLRVAAESAHLGQPEILVGIIPGAGGTQRLPRLVGPGRAADLVLSGRVVDAQEALRIGLVEAVRPDEGFLEHALAYAQGLAVRPRRALVAAKRALIDGLRLPLDEGLRLEGRLSVECQTSPEAVSLEEQLNRRYREAGDEGGVRLDGLSGEPES
jgi:enoyl-CoA hydratase/carnithine racemase